MLRSEKKKFAQFGRKLLIAAPALSLLALASLSAEEVQRNPIVIQAQHVTTTVPVRDMAEVPSHNASKIMPEHDMNPNPHVSHGPDAAAQTEDLPQVATTNILSFDGITDAQGGGYVPPDTNASVGDTQVVETVNVAYAVYNKTTGAVIMAPKGLQTLYSPLGGLCATANLSDPTVLYDKAAGRWVISMVTYNNSFTANGMCVAVSTSSDATGTYHLYFFNYKGVLPDYPKLGVWPDAYYLTTDSFPLGGAFTGAESCALNRTNMLAGTAATSICFQRTSADFAMLPADLDGATAPPAGAPNYEMDEGSTATTLNLYKFHVDFTIPANSTFTGPTVLTVASYSDACPVSYCIPEPTPGELLDALGGRLMFRLPYRNYGDHEAMVATHSITPTSGTAKSAARWYEIRNPSTAPAIFQQGTLVHPSISVWMGSVAMDKTGDIALGISGSSPSTKPLIAYVGRVPTDALGKMEAPFVVVHGGGVQESSFDRWGDYSSMAIDPSDDCTFWYAQEYYKTSGSFNFSTHMNSFKFTACH